MQPDRATVLAALDRLNHPDGGTLVSRDLVRALSIDDGRVRFVIEAATPAEAQQLTPLRKQAEEAVAALDGVRSVQALLTAHGPAPKTAPKTAPKSGPETTPPAADAPSLKIGRHATPGPSRPQGVDRILAIASGKGGVGKSTVSANLAVALAREGRRVGLLDADIYGPSQPRMMGVNRRPASPDGKTILPLHAHGVTLMSIGFMLPADEAVIWRGPMLMGALQQLLTQVAWGELDVLIVDMPPGTGDIQLTLCQRTDLTGAIVVSTPQDVALLDARKALAAFRTLKTPVLGLIENMSTYICPKCGHEAHVFGHGGVEAEARALDLPFLGAMPLNIETRLAGDAGTPIAATDSPMAEPWRRLARHLVAGGMA